MDVLADEVVAKQQEVIDVTSAFEDYRDRAEIVYWAGGVVIVRCKLGSGWENRYKDQTPVGAEYALGRR